MFINRKGENKTRLWHYEIIPYLPKSQLIAQWRELNSIFAKQNKHILINYIYNYPKDYLYSYSSYVLDEMKKRGYQIKKWDNYNEYFGSLRFSKLNMSLIYSEHNSEYFEICYWNLKEKYFRGQSDFTADIYYNMRNAYIRHIEKKNSK